MGKFYQLITPVLLLILLLWQTLLNAQDLPVNGINYQAIARDSNGVELANIPLGIHIRILTGMPPQNEVFYETHQITTNQFGLFNIIIGSGIVTKGKIDTLHWASEAHFLEVSILPEGAISPISMGTTSFQAVPYAFTAGSATNAPPGLPGPPGPQGAPGPDGDASNSWMLEGNTGRSPALGNFLGTIDNEDFEIRTFNIPRLTISRAGNVGIGTSQPVGKLSVLSTDEDGFLSSSMYSNMNSYVNGFVAIRSRGTESSPVPLINGDVLGGIGFAGQYGTTLLDQDVMAGIIAYTTENYTTNARGSALSFMTTLNGTTNNQARMIINHNGNVSIGLNPPNKFAILDIQSNNKGILLPRLTTAQRIAMTGMNLNEQGLLVYDTDLNNLVNWNGFAWDTIGSPSGLQEAYLAGNIISGSASMDLNLVNGFVAKGVLNNGGIPASGAGSRMLWYPGKSSFRAGNVSGTEWDDINTGSISFAGGSNTTASGNYSTAFGRSTIASGTSAFVAGELSTASGVNSMALGHNAYSTGSNSIALGYAITAGNANTIVIGSGISNASQLQHNIKNSMAIGFNSDIPTLFVGGSSGAGTIGNVGIGTTSPEALLNIITNGVKPFQLGHRNQPNLEWFFNVDGAANFSLMNENNGAPLTRFYIDNTGKVGIGTTTPSTSLETNGHIKIPAANDYLYASGKIHYLSFAPTSFASAMPDEYLYRMNDTSEVFGYFVNGNAGEFGYASAGVHLPDGAVITKLTAWLFEDDKNTFDPVRIELWENPFLGQGAKNRVTFVTYDDGVSNNPTLPKEVNSISVSHTVDNLNKAYSLIFVGELSNKNTRLYGVRITYTVTKAD